MTATIIAGAVILAVLTIASVLYPVFRASGLGRRYTTDSVTGDRLADLLAQRDAVYDAIRDADFDRETGKLTADDHRLMRERLTAEGVRLLQELDRLMQSDVRDELERQIETDVAALRRSWQVEPAQAASATARRVPPAISPQTTGYDGQVVRCHACGRQVRAGARFCTHCGVSRDSTCPVCGKPFEAGDRFCGGCGAALPATDGADRVAPAQLPD